MEGLNRLFIALSICEWNDEFWCERVRRSVLLPWQQGFATPSPSRFLLTEAPPPFRAGHETSGLALFMVRGTDGPA